MSACNPRKDDGPGCGATNACMMSRGDRRLTTKTEAREEARRQRRRMTSYIRWRKKKKKKKSGLPQRLLLLRYFTRTLQQAAGWTRKRRRACSLHLLQGKAGKGFPDRNIERETLAGLGTCSIVKRNKRGPESRDGAKGSTSAKTWGRLKFRPEEWGVHSAWGLSWDCELPKG